ncbi:MAG: erythromycin esterase family protein [Alphaproteobacteria bacterium]|nr:erythromycin esterase family protein [Alphaproteobacteria bacterium]MCB9697907.1 erythromycin esterase family protein [Alphaproteobacteria bacterium]
MIVWSLASGTGLAADRDEAWAEFVAAKATPMSWKIDARDDDLERLAPMLDGVRIVAFGETTHGTAQFREARDRMTRWLVEEQGFTLVLPEMLLAGSRRLHTFLTTGDGDAASALDTVGGWVWDTREDAAAMEWATGPVSAGTLGFWPIDVQDPQGDLDALAALGRRIDDSEVARVVGELDTGRPLVYPTLSMPPLVAGGAQHRVLRGRFRASGRDVRALILCYAEHGAFIRRIDLTPDVWRRFEAPLPPDSRLWCSLRLTGDGTLDVSGWELDEDGVVRVLTTQEGPEGDVSPARALSSSLSAEGTWSLTTRSVRDTEFVGRLVRLADDVRPRREPWAPTVEALARASAWGLEIGWAPGRAASALRDRAMADQVVRFLDRAGPEARAVVWAHEDHVRADDREPRMGAHLRAAFGEQYLPIALLTSGGTYRASRDGGVSAFPLEPPARRCLERAFDPLPTDAAFVALRGTDLGSRPMLVRSIGAEHRPGVWQFRPWWRVIPEAYDALWWIRVTTATESGGPVD